MTNNKNKKGVKNPKKNKNKPQQRRVPPQIIYRDVPQKNSVLGNVGQFAGNTISKIFGWGDYVLQQNSVYDSITRGQVPFMHSGSESVVLRHREYICDVSSSVAFTSTSYDVNPGLGATFPYLSAVAQNFQEYEFLGLVFEFKSTSADALNSTNTALGTVSLAAQYRSDAPDFFNKQQLLNEMWSVDTKPADSTMLPVECAPMERPMKLQYIRTGDVPSGQDQKLYDLCKLTVATVGSQAAAVVGELWATYEVKLYKPTLVDPLNISEGYFGLANGAAVTTSAFFGSNPVLWCNTLGLTVGASTITFPRGSQGAYIFCVDWYGVSGSVTGPAINATNCQTFNAWHGGSNYSENTPAATTTTDLILNFIVYIADPNKIATINFSGGTLPASTGVDVVISGIGLPTTSSGGLAYTLH